MKGIKYPVVIAFLLCSCTDREGGASDTTSVQVQMKDILPTKVMAESSAPIVLERIERKVADLPEKRVAVQFTKAGFVINNRAAAYGELHRRLGELQGEAVYCEIDKFARIPDQQLEGLASVVIQSGGRFFYRQILGAIDSLFFCVELREDPDGRPMAQSSDGTKIAEQDDADQPTAAVESKPE